MKCPAYVKRLIRRRAHHAAEFVTIDADIVDWMQKNGIDICSPQFTDHILGGVVSICEPYASGESLIEEIEKWGTGG